MTDLRIETSYHSPGATPNSPPPVTKIFSAVPRSTR